MSFVDALGPENIRIRVTCTADSVAEMIAFYHFARERFGPVKMDFAPAICGTPQDPSITARFIAEFSEMKREMIRLEIAESMARTRLTHDEVLERLQSDNIYQRRMLTARCEFGVNLLSHNGRWRHISVCRGCWPEGLRNGPRGRL